MSDFPEFFRALWERDPFPWQTMLAERGLRGEWPEAIDLPTASGKTACLDAAVYSLALTGSSSERMPRRIWFIVDRRIVVDEAFDRARALAKKLSAADGPGPVKDVADRLRELAGTRRPLAVARLRGGVWRDDGWARLPCQPAIICSTVDQVGSSLLFRAYGRSDRTASIYAGLASHDSLILLDEAHCAVPFLQTLRAVARFRGKEWAEEPLRTPFRFSVLSATLRPDGAEGVFPSVDERTAALDHRILQQRLHTQKLTKLVTVRTSRGSVDPFISEAIAQVREIISSAGIRRVAVMVNRVATAEVIAERLRDTSLVTAEIVLLTGRMRPLDRDALLKRWTPVLKSDSDATPEKPVVVVTTQCLEVGADFSFDVLVTECASLDALRQRFGRLDRLGKLGESRAVILTRGQDTKEPKDRDVDPIYGKAIYETWKWLKEVEQHAAAFTVDFGVNAMDAQVETLRQRDEERFRRLLAPAPDAPVLLPAHLDLLCQTAPRPTPEPDVALFLHGKERGSAEVRVVLRADLRELSKSSDALENLSLLPPTSPEMLTVPLHHLRQWLVEEDAGADLTGDVEGELEGPDYAHAGGRRSARSAFVLWRGRDHSEVTRDLGSIRPDDVVVIAADLGLRGLGQVVPDPHGLGPDRLDVAECAIRQARGRVALRLQEDLLETWLKDYPALNQVRELAFARDYDRDAVREVLTAMVDSGPRGERRHLPDWLDETVQLLLKDDFRIHEHPAGGVVVVGKKLSLPEGIEAEDEAYADEDDLTSWSSDAVTLRAHTADCREAAVDFARRCLGHAFVDSFGQAAEAHDLGKLDDRFQLLLHGGDQEATAAATEPLAKSSALPEPKRRHGEIGEDARLPPGFRHEFLSMQLAERFGLTPNDLTLHLIASHHGHARPLAPIVLDSGVSDISLASVGTDDVTFTASGRQRAVPAHQIDSGVAERFWRLTRRHGWWGLAYLESVFRLADWRASRYPRRDRGVPLRVSRGSTRVLRRTGHAIALDALDGSNPLAFLAALGTLRLASRAFPERDLRLSWSQRLGAWRPLLHAVPAIDEDLLVDVLHREGVDLETMFSAELLVSTLGASPKNKKGDPRWKDKLLFPISGFRGYCNKAAIEPGARAEFAAGWAGETVPIGKDHVELARRTRFDFTAGQQAFIAMLRELRRSCLPEDLSAAILTRWRYSPAAVSMRWDPQDEKRQYALQAVDPQNGSANPSLADPGANFLAVEALPLFPLVPDRHGNQPGFQKDEEGQRWCWPIWTTRLGLDVVRSLLTLDLAHAERWPASRRRALGVAVVFQSGIVQPSGRYRCFTPARSV